MPKKSLRGKLLVASPYLGDPNFHRSVVLMIHHAGDGAFGVVLNRPTSRTLAEVWEGAKTVAGTAKKPLHFGGPVSGPLMALHTNSQAAEMEVLDGVYFAAERKHIETLLRSADEYQFRLFVGHSGWGGGQLERELKEGSWLVAPASTELIFADESSLWQTVSQSIGRVMFGTMLGIKDFPPSAECN